MTINNKRNDNLQFAAHNLCQ